MRKQEKGRAQFSILRKRNMSSRGRRRSASRGCLGGLRKKKKKKGVGKGKEEEISI